jgi:hypothetical protein
LRAGLKIGSGVPVTRAGSYFAAFLIFAQRAFCAATIRARPAADMVRFFVGAFTALAGFLPGVRFAVVPVDGLSPRRFR